MYQLHFVAPAAAAQRGAVYPVNIRYGYSLGIKLRHLYDGVIYPFYFIPRRPADNAVHGEVEYALELPHRRPRGRLKHTVGLRDIRYRRVVAPDPVELALDRSDILTHRAEAQQSAGVGFPDILDGHIAHKVDIRAVIIAEYLYRSSALVCQGDGPPLRHSLAGDVFAVAILGEIRLYLIALCDVAVEYLVDYPADIAEDIPAVDIRLIVGGGVCDIEVIASAAVILRVNSIERKGNLGVYVRPERILGPGGVDLA